MPSDDNKNLILAIALSVLVMVGWNYFYGVPKLAEQRQQVSQQTVPPSAPAKGIVAGTRPGLSSAPAIVKMSRQESLAQSPRVAISSPSLVGSIALKGGRIDDLSLRNYRETVDPQSPLIVLFSPAGGHNAYFADFGWLPPPGQAISVPTMETLWSANGESLSPGGVLVLSWDNGQGLTFTRSFAMDERYLFTVKDSVTNKSSAPVTLSSYGRVTRQGTPTTLGFYILHEGLVGYLEDKLQESTYSDLQKTRSKRFEKSEGGWLGMTDKYWAAALIPAHDKAVTAAFGINSTNTDYDAAMFGEAITLAPGASAEASLNLFAGAKEVATINHYGAALGIKKFDLMIDWGWFYFITKPLFTLMEAIYHLVGNFGVTILIITVLLKALFFPLANKSYASMAKMKAVQPEINAVRERFADDKMKQQQAMMDLYKKEKINPMAGCLPVIIQIPVFFALYKVLFVTIEMRHAPFFAWIKDLAAPDPSNLFNLFGLLPFTPPDPLHLGVWPLIMGVTMWLQMKMNPEPADPIQKTMFAWMPVIFTFMLGSFPAGLVIYWAWNNLLSVAQQYAIMRKMGTKVELWDNLRKTFKRA